MCLLSNMMEDEPTSGSLDVTAAALGNSTSPNSGNAVTTADGVLQLRVIMTSDPETYTAGPGYRELKGMYRPNPTRS